ncbi:reverse transcriptase domain-containing protein [Sphingomonas sp. ABOLE]|uniref:reverse transcriptase domain-containing protein n=1 Tax=Sphingomonas sp. ABOLE TaxID=1985878 RepID=UPI0013DEE6CE|nr:reverse transcriptase domain-containing protein [Sphingomonas sp. ABOLE]
MRAWHAIRRNAETSQQDATKNKAKIFGEDLPKNLRVIQDRLKKGYKFAPAYGATPPKGGGKVGKRPIVVAPLEDRIVQRAILDVLQDATEVAGVQRVLRTPTSIGGIKGRGVDHAIAIFDERVKAGDRFVAGSDISGFFTKIPRERVLAFFEREGVEADFLRLIRDGLTVELSNVDKLSDDDLKMFPTGADGVAQGCPLSALAGNIVLESFDSEMNGRGITCIRYIDDFLVIGKTRASVEAAMRAARGMLNELGMSIYDPATSPKKAFIGEVDEGHPFLGYELRPGSYPPSLDARARLHEQIAALIASGQKAITKAVSGRALTSQDRCYAQTLVRLDQTIRGWRRSFKSSKCPAVFEQLDREIDRRLHDFRAFYLDKIRNRTPAQQRMAARVSLVSEQVEAH